MGRGFVFAHRAYEVLSDSAEGLFLGRVFVREISVDANTAETVMLPCYYPSGSVASYVCFKMAPLWGRRATSWRLKAYATATRCMPMTKTLKKEQHHL